MVFSRRRLVAVTTSLGLGLSMAGCGEREESAGEVLDGAIGSIETGVRGAADFVADKADKVGAFVVEIVDDTETIVDDAVEDSVDGVKKGARKAGEKADDAVSDAGDRAGELMDSASDNVGGAVEDLGKGIRN